MKIPFGDSSGGDSSGDPSGDDIMREKIETAVFPVAGFGTRFLPATKTNPKEMLPIVDKPLIQFAVEEALAAGVKKLVFINSKGKRNIEDHFDTAYKLRELLKKSGKNDLLEQLDIIPDDAVCIYVRQGDQMGLGAAVLCAEPVVGDQPFALLLPDDFIVSRPDGVNCTQSLVDIWKRHHSASVLAVTSVSDEEVRSYGVIGGDRVEDRLTDVKHIIEKPEPDQVSNRLGIVGRYILDPRVFHHLKNTKPGVGDEVQLTDALEKLREESQILAYEYEGVRYDCGSKIGYVCATCDYALNRPDMRDELIRHIKSRIGDFD